MGQVLVVDDDPGLRAVMSDLLTIEGYTVATADNGAAALEQVRRARPDLILLDLMMPVMDGWTFARQCLADPVGQGVPIVVVSASRGTKAVLQDLADTDVRAVIDKPFDVDELLALVAAHSAS